MAQNFKRKFKNLVPRTADGQALHLQQVTDDLGFLIDRGLAVGGAIPFEFQTITISPNSTTILASPSMVLRGAVLIETSGTPVSEYAFKRVDNGLQFIVGALPENTTVTVLLVGDRK